MSRTIWKYKLFDNGLIRSFLTMPIGAEILTVQRQGNDACIWALVDPDENVLVDRHFVTYGTGHKILVPSGKELKYVGTFQFDYGQHIFHTFEVVDQL